MGSSYSMSTDPMAELASCALNGKIENIKNFIENGFDVDISLNVPISTIYHCGYNCEDNKHLNLLFCAVYADQYEICEYLIKKGANVNIYSYPPINYNLLMTIITKDKTKVINTKLCQLLIDNGCDINYTNSLKMTVLLYSIINGHSRDVVEFWLKNGSNVNVINMNSLTPLHIASLLGYYDICVLLVEYGADVLETDFLKKRASYYWSSQHWPYNRNNGSNDGYTFLRQKEKEREELNQCFKRLQVHVEEIHIEEDINDDMEW
jgi:ankyrin repeat protein